MPHSPDDLHSARLERNHRAANLLGHVGLPEFVDYLSSPMRIIWTNLLAGIFRGLGFVLGATVVLAVVTFVLVRVLGGLPWVGDFFRNAGLVIEQIQEAGKAIQTRA